MALIKKFLRPGVHWTLTKDIVRNLQSIFNHRQGHSSPIAYVELEGLDLDVPEFEDEMTRQITAVVSELEPRVEILNVKVNPAARPRPTVALKCRIVATNEYLEFDSAP